MYGRHLTLPQPPSVNYNDEEHNGLRLVWPDGEELLAGLKDLKSPPCDWQQTLADTPRQMILWADIPDEGPLRLGVGRVLGPTDNERWIKVRPTLRFPTEIVIRTILGALGGDPRELASLDKAPVAAVNGHLMRDIMWVVPSDEQGLRFMPSRWLPPVKG